MQDEEFLFPGMENFVDEPVRPDGPDAAKDTTNPPGPPKGQLSDEEVTKKAGGTFREFISIHDTREAETCIRELGCTEAQEGLVVAAALTECYECQNAVDRHHVYKVLVHLADLNLLSSEGFRLGFLVRRRSSCVIVLYIYIYTHNNLITDF
jgi:hypothetical protein